jgi:hypothetical protein
MVRFVSSASGDLRIEPARTTLAGIGFQQDARLQGRFRWRLTLGDQRIQPITLGRVQLHDKLLGRHLDPSCRL